MEFGVKIIPSIVFFVLGAWRYFGIRDIGQGRVVYSKHFKFKFSISAAMGSALILYSVITWGQHSDAVHSSWVNQCSDDYFILFYVI